MNVYTKKIGIEIRIKNFLMFFGNKLGSFEAIADEYNELNWNKIKQVHGDQCIQSKHFAKIIEADAHWTDQVNTGLLIATADCLPIMGFESNTGRIIAIHAGWRGVENQILTKSISNLSGQWSFVIGPHIGFRSFNVKTDVWKLFQGRFGQNLITNSKKTESTGVTEPRYKINLSGLVAQQIADSRGVLLASLLIDTVVSDEHYSFRREPSQSDRNLNFIARLT
jgi:copper oxidase (laccase) domain-containing protein